MDVRAAIKEQAKYPDVVAWFYRQGELDTDQMTLLADIIEEMSDQIYEHYRALCDLLKSQLQRVRRVCREQGCSAVYPDSSEREQLSCVISKAGALGAVLPEKYEDLLKMLNETKASSELG